MITRILNKTLHTGWYFDLGKVPIFIGAGQVEITDANLLMAGSIDQNYSRSDLFLVSKNSVWIKRFSGLGSQRDLYIQITDSEAVQWLRNEGYLADDETFEMPEILKKAVKLEFPPVAQIRTISIKDPNKVEEPARFLDGLGNATSIPWPDLILTTDYEKSFDEVVSHR